MQAQLVTVNVSLHNSPGEMYDAVEKTLRQWGTPLRWAIMAVDAEAQQVSVEGLVTAAATVDQATKPGGGQPLTAH